MDRVARDDVERSRLPEDAAVVQPDHDMRHDLHRRRAERGERRLEVLDRAVEVIDVANRLRRADDVHHGGVDARPLPWLRPRLVEQRRVDRDPCSCGKSRFSLSITG